MEISPEQSPDVVVFLYCRHDEKRTIPEYLASLIAQLVQKHSNIPALLEAIYKLYDLHHLQGTQPSKLELLNILHHLVSMFNNVHIVLDALDEVQDCNQMELIADLRSIGGSLLFTSRSMGAEVFDLPR